MNQSEITPTQESSKGIVELAKMFKERENFSQNEPMFGTIKSLTPVQIQLDGKKILIESKNIVSVVNLAETDSFGNYVNLERRVAMLPFNTGYTNSMPDFIVLGVIQ
ncbi:MAG: hypothetical protein MRZ66_00205 [Clostridiales bacterium]|nr:hypothetical protein [Clostridiales bacterium]